MRSNGHQSECVNFSIAGIAVSVLIVLIAILIPRMATAFADSKAMETKSNLHTVQEAVERYFTDQGTYPDFLLGGDHVRIQDVIGHSTQYSVFEDFLRDLGLVAGALAVGIPALIIIAAFAFFCVLAGAADQQGAAAGAVGQA